jgi:hypothetical protein
MVCCWHFFRLKETEIGQEVFWLDLVLNNPLNVEVNISNLTAIVREDPERDAVESVELTEVEVVPDLILGANEVYTVSVVGVFSNGSLMLFRYPFLYV